VTFSLQTTYQIPRSPSPANVSTKISRQNIFTWTSSHCRPLPFLTSLVTQPPSHNCLFCVIVSLHIPPLLVFRVSLGVCCSLCHSIQTLRVAREHPRTRNLLTDQQLCALLKVMGLRECRKKGIYKNCRLCETAWTCLYLMCTLLSPALQSQFLCFTGRFQASTLANHHHSFIHLFELAYFCPFAVQSPFPAATACISSTNNH
jgi:hypothetical protein